MGLIKTEDEITLIKQSSLLVGKTLAVVAEYIKPGIHTKQLDSVAEEFIRSQNAVPAFKNYRGFPATLCISLNDKVVHGIPDETELRDGDVVSVDCGVICNGYYGDSAFTFPVGEVKPEILQLLIRTKESLYIGIDAAVAGNRVGDIGYAVQKYVESFGYSVVRELVGHGLGKKLHEEPQVPNFGKRGSGQKLEEGMVICIEPMINLGKKEVRQENDGWTIRTRDKMPSAHFEHAIVIRKNKSEILSSFEFIEKVENINIKVNF